MSKISDDIRSKVADLSVSDHYGEWGALNPTQRRDIRKLCDTCDMFEATADRFKTALELAQCKSIMINKIDDNTKDEMLRIMKTQQIGVLSSDCGSVEIIPSATVEAINEFAERVKEYFNPDDSYDVRQYIDNLKKEMVGEQ